MSSENTNSTPVHDPHVAGVPAVATSMKQLRSGEELGSWKPSQLLRLMRLLVKDTGSLNDEVLKALFLQQMPLNVKQILLSISDATPEQIANIAEKILEHTPCIAAVSNANATNSVAASSADSVTILTNKLDSTLQRLDHLERDGCWGDRSRTTTPDSDRHQNCWYHYKFGAQAKERTAPCTYTNKKNKKATQSSKLHFLIDTGADLLSASFKIRNFDHTSHFNLQSADGLRIKVSGHKIIMLDIGLHRAFTWTFVVASVTYAIIDADFLRHYGLSNVLQNRRLIDNKTFLMTECRCKYSRVTNIHAGFSGDSRYADILRRYPDVIRPTLLPKESNYWVVHHIPLRDPPVHCKPRQLAPDKLKAARQEFQKMLNSGIIRPSSSPWASPLHLISVHPDDHKTATTTPFVLFKFTRMPFDLRNAAQTFQRFLDQIFRGLDFVYVYIDDILIASESEDKHARHLEIVWKLLNQCGIIVNPKKCTFGASELTFLEIKVSQNGLEPLSEKAFLGMANYYRRWMPNAAIIQKPLTDLLKGTVRKNTKISWNDTTKQAFKRCKSELANTVILAFPDTTAKISLAVDASKTAIGGVLQQNAGSECKPISFFSRKLTDTEKKYSTYDKELLAVYNGIRHFRHFLEGWNFTIFTDHRQLTFAFLQKPDKCKPRQCSQLDFMSQFTTEIRYVRGTESSIADPLSRVASIQQIEFNPKALQDAQDTDPELQQLLHDPKFKFQNSPDLLYDANVWCETSTGTSRCWTIVTVRRCSRCLYEHIQGRCPAYNKTLAKCQGRNHFTKACKALNVNNENTSTSVRPNVTDHNKRVNQLQETTSDQEAPDPHNIVEEEFFFFSYKLPKTAMKNPGIKTSNLMTTQSDSSSIVVLKSASSPRKN
ncbi:hypothetical protein ILUMI_12216 [Ignelater luminosus]|uniref:Reverse transcriptase domain-containing protein n=1 Tax=Ignelater luminosus TaxID=2038154 RepID=A0A8K0CZZ9_IGNLU|nr:hypothetical protein ILUMI_12216 [Ignelater luminosus]